MGENYVMRSVRKQVRKGRKLDSLPHGSATFIEPMECLAVTKLPDGPQWVHEIKLDGYRERVLAIPSKRHTRPLVHFLDRPEIDALLAAPDQTTWFGRRDHALLLVAMGRAACEGTLC